MIEYPDDDATEKEAEKHGIPEAVLVRDLVRIVEVLNLADRRWCGSWIPMRLPPRRFSAGRSTERSSTTRTWHSSPWPPSRTPARSCTSMAPPFATRSMPSSRLCDKSPSSVLGHGHIEVQPSAVVEDVGKRRAEPALVADKDGSFRTRAIAARGLRGSSGNDEMPGRRRMTAVAVVSTTAAGRPFRPA